MFLLVFLALAIAAVYIFIPSNIKINKAFIVHASPGALQRNFLTQEGWNKWFATGKNGIRFSEITPLPFDNASVLISDKKINHLSQVQTSMLPGGTIGINWSCNISAGNSPFDRMSKYAEAKRIKLAMDDVALRISDILNNSKQSYGFHVRQVTLTDNSMIATRDSLDHYPTVADIYGKIELLEKYALSNNAVTTNSTMLNIQRTHNGHYHFMVSLPVNKLLKNSAGIQYKQMLPKGNFLSTDSLFGGFQHLDSLFSEFENYKRDYNFASPAIPFQSLITDRRKEPDSSKWITKFYYPIY